MNMFEYVTKADDIYGKLIRALQNSYEISFDVESNSLDPYTGTLILVQIKVNDEIFIINATKLENIYLTKLAKIIKDLNLKLIGHNIKFDIKYLFTKTGILIENVYDTQLAESMITGGDNLYSSYSELVTLYCGDYIDKDVREYFINFDGNVTQEMLIYSALDVEYLSNIKEKQLILIKETKQEKVQKLEMELLPVVASMELNGIHLDAEQWSNILKENTILKDELYLKISKVIWDKYIESGVEKGTTALEVCDRFKITENTKTKKDRKFLEDVTELGFLEEIFIKRFNSSSTNQIKQAFELFRVDVKSTGEKVLNGYIRDNNPSEEQKNLITVILDYRKQAKKVSSYGKDFIDRINPITNKLHADFMQIGTRTGRFACKKPALQTIPAEQEYRGCFIPSPGYCLLTVDYSQQEYRLVGAVSREPMIISAYKQDIDIHTATASAVYGIPIEKVTKAERNAAKAINFGILYGSSAYGLAYNLNISVQKAEELLAHYFSLYKVLTRFKALVEERVWDLLYSVTPLGRRRNFELKSFFANGKEGERYEAMVKREGFNHIIQGGGGDMMKQAMVNIYYRNPFKDLLRIVLQVHDEVVVEVHESILNQASEFVVNCMVDAGKLFLGEIPTEVSVSDVYTSWSK